jgi:hypothetical protein
MDDVNRSQKRLLVMVALGAVIVLIVGIEIFLVIGKY